MENRGLKFPKTGRKKKKKRYRRRGSILPQEKGTCYLCVALHKDFRYHRYLETHHIFGGASRKWSDTYGLTVELCLEHHREGPEAVHQNSRIMERLHRIGQQAFEREYPEEDFQQIFGKNYI